MPSATVTSRGPLTVASFIKSPAITEHAMNVNGLATREPVKDRKCDKECSGKREKRAHAPRIKNRLVHLFLLLVNIAFVRAFVNG